MEQTIRPVPKQKPRGPFKRWLLEGQHRDQDEEGPHIKEHVHPSHSWWQVMCLTGVDYFSTLGYQPGIAALAAGSLSPFATGILVLLTLFGALPIYRRVAEESPHGEGSISMLEHLLSRWKGKLLVLCLLGFVATAWVITITLSAADATAHIAENPFLPESLRHHEVLMTLLLIGLLGAVFLKGFKEAINIAVVLVVVYLALNIVVLGMGFYQIASHTTTISDWQTLLFTSHENGNVFLMIGLVLVAFPQLALGLSGFETGVAVMPLVRGDPDDTEAKPVGRIRNTRKLLSSAAIIMSVFLLASSIVTTLLIPAAEFLKGGKANGRALAYVAHEYLGDVFGTIYDVSTISILWFAGASALAGLLNIVPQYLPRYGMAPSWTRAARPLVLVYTVITFIVTIIFEADVDAQAGAYATGVLVVMSSGAVAVTLSAWRRKARRAAFAFGLITAIFLYTTAVNIIERPEGLQIALLFIGGIIVVSLISRVLRSTELRAKRIDLDDQAEEFIRELSKRDIRLIANALDIGDAREYRMKEKEVRDDNHVPAGDPIIFLEINVRDASEFEGILRVRGVKVDKYKILRIDSASVPNAIAAFLLHLRETTGKIPHVYFGWSEGNPLRYLFRFIVFGEGDIAPVTREILRQAEPDPERRPGVHVGG